jgi:hypothetical protein
MTRKEKLVKKLEHRKQFFKKAEEGYPETVAKMSTTALKMNYHDFKLAIKEYVGWLDEAYNDYINNNIDNVLLNYRVTDAKICIDHWQKMQEIIVNELLKRAV